MNVEKILNYKRPKETHYDILGCAQSSTMEQINREYKIRALQLHPDKNLEDPDSLERFRSLQKAKDTLSEVSSRKSYDCWLNSGINIPFEQWQARKGHSLHWAPPRSSKLSIGDQNNSSSGQGSDYTAKNIPYRDAPIFQKQHHTQGGDLLEKFRNYEI